MDEKTISILKALILLVALLQVAPVMLWIERRGAALMQNRLGPNRVGPFGLIQALADVIKFLWKEDPIPPYAKKGFYLLAPLLILVPAFLTFAVIPVASPLSLGDHVLTFQVADLDIGILYSLAIASVGVYGIIVAGWASNSIYALWGSLRSSCQMVSYELSMGLSILSMVMIVGSVKLNDIAVFQGQELFRLGFFSLPKLGIFLQPIGFIIFLTTIFAETNRLPFDLPEGESELVAGYHLEYGAMKFAMFMMAEYLNMVTACGLLTTLYLGGWQLLPGLQSVVDFMVSFYNMSHFGGEIALRFAQGFSFIAKLGFFMWVFVWVRWTLPRFRYDQLMDLGWKLLLPLSLANLCVTAGLIAIGRI